MAQWLRELVAIAEDPGLILSTHLAANVSVTSVPMVSEASSDLCRHRMHMMHRQTCRQNIHICKIKINVLFTKSQVLQFRDKTLNKTKSVSASEKQYSKKGGKIKSK